MINLDEIKARCERYKTEEQFDGVYIETYLADVEQLLENIEQLTAENAHWEEINDTQAEQLGVAYDKTAELLAENKTLRGELCLHCGKYLISHLGLCNNCRWRDSVDANKMDCAAAAMEKGEGE